MDVGHTFFGDLKIQVVYLIFKVKSCAGVVAFAGVGFNKSLTIATNTDGTAWRTDTSYISRTDPDVDRSTFFTMENIEKRSVNSFY